MKNIQPFFKYNFSTVLVSLFVLITLAFSAHSEPKMLSTEDFNKLLSQTFDVMEQHYVEPALVPKIRELITHRAALGFYKDVLFVDEFAKVIGQDIRAIAGDKHLSLFTVEPEDEVTHVLTHQSGKLTYNYAFEEVRYLTGNIGYLKFNKFHPDERAREVVDAAFTFLKQSEGVIIDMRDTIGGSPSLAQYMLSYFFPQGTPLWEVQGKSGQILDTVKVTDKAKHDYFHSNAVVWILTSHNTASASELFAGIMQANSKAKIVGEVTAGAGYYVGVRQITDELVFRISLSKPVISANQKNWEKTGIVPDVEVTGIDAFDRAVSFGLGKLLLFSFKGSYLGLAQWLPK